MAISFEDLLSALCTEFQPQHANDFQKIFLIADAREAKLAFDVLVAFGFDAKVYPDAAKGSKLYLITPPAMDARAEERFAQAVAYAKALRGIKHSLDALPPPGGYTMTFANAPGNNKQINIVLTQPATAIAPAAAPARPAQQAAAPAPKRKPMAMKAEAVFSTSGGPTLGARSYPGGLDEKAQTRQSSLKRQIFLYLTGNAATGGVAVMFVIVVLAILFTLFILSKSLLCPDFATAKKNVAWYCQSSEE